MNGYRDDGSPVTSPEVDLEILVDVSLPIAEALYLIFSQRLSRSLFLPCSPQRTTIFGLESADGEASTRTQLELALPSLRVARAFELTFRTASMFLAGLKCG